VGEAYKQNRGKYPSQLSGTECLPEGLTWAAINSALVNGYRGLPGGQSLSQLVQSLKDEDRVTNVIDEFADFIRGIDPVQASRTRIIAKLWRLRRLLDGSDEMDGQH